MRTHITALLLLGSTGVATANTFDAASIAPEDGIDVFTREVAEQHLERRLLSAPYDAVIIGNVDVYDVFPYVEARYFQVVSDPGWNRLLFGATEYGFSAFDGTGAEVGALSRPRGLAVDANGRVFVADSGNDRVLVLESRATFDRLELEPLFVVNGLHDPHDVAIADAGTPFDVRDDRLYVADTGRNQIVAFSLGVDGAERVASIGGLGSGPGRFAGPTAIATGRHEGASTQMLFVADAHSRRIVRLADTGGALRWDGETSLATDVVTSLDTDHWGNVYACAPSNGVTKFTPDLFRLAALTADVSRPRSFHVPFVNVHDHRTGVRSRSGQSSAIVVEDWTASSGVRLYGLGVEARDLTIDDDAESGDDLTARFTLTDRARVTVELCDGKTGMTLARRSTDPLSSGRQAVSLRAEDFTAVVDPGEHVLRVSARSTYEGGDEATAEESVVLTGGGAALVPDRPVLLGSRPNPARAATRIRFLAPNEPGVEASLRFFDARGRLVRSVAAGPVVAGLNEIAWDGLDEAGEPVATGAYFYRLRVGADELVHRVILVR